MKRKQTRGRRSEYTLTTPTTNDEEAEEGRRSENTLTTPTTNDEEAREKREAKERERVNDNENKHPRL